MKKLFLIIPITFLFGCATTGDLETTIDKTKDGYKITMDSPGKVNYEVGDVKISVDLNEPSLLQTLTEAAVVQALERKDE